MLCLGYWSFERLKYGAYGAGPLVNDQLVSTRKSNCDRSASKVCDIFIKFFIDGELATETEVTHNTPEAEIEVQFESRLIRKDSIVRIEMWDEDDDVFDTEAILENSDILLNKTFTVQELINKDQLIIYADQRPKTGSVPDNFIEIFDSVWSMD